MGMPCNCTPPLIASRGPPDALASWLHAADRHPARRTLPARPPDSAHPACTCLDPGGERPRSSHRLCARRYPTLSRFFGRVQHSAWIEAHGKRFPGLRGIAIPGHGFARPGCQRSRSDTSLADTPSGPSASLLNRKTSRLAFREPTRPSVARESRRSCIGSPREFGLTGQASVAWPFGDSRTPQSPRVRASKSVTLRILPRAKVRSTLARHGAVLRRAGSFPI
jgi:hypothetical protein